MIESIIVVAIVAIVLVLAGRSFYRTMTGKKSGCGGSCLQCPSKDSLAKIEERGCHP